MAKQTMAQYMDEQTSIRNFKTVIATILSKRFGEVSSEVNAKIHAINDLTHLTKLFEEAVDVPSIADLQLNPAKKLKK